VVATAIDAIRSQARYDRAFLHACHHVDTTPEQLVLERLERAELWELVSLLTTTEAERGALHERFVLDLPPRIIQSRHPALFADVKVVYAAIRNVCDRLRRHKESDQFSVDLAA
jgi:hypothetical protein